MFDNGHNTRGEEPCGAHRLAGTRDLDDLDRRSSHRHLNPPAGACGDDVKVAHTVADIDDDFDSIASHQKSLRRSKSHRSTIDFAPRSGVGEQAFTFEDQDGDNVLVLARGLSLLIQLGTGVVPNQNMDVAVEFASEIISRIPG